MAQEYGAAQPIVDYFRKGVDTVRSALDRVPTPQRKQDTSWHDSMVRTAQESHRLAQEKDRAAAVRARTTKRSTAPAKKSRPTGR